MDNHSLSHLLYLGTCGTILALDTRYKSELKRAWTYKFGNIITSTFPCTFVCHKNYLFVGHECKLVALNAETGQLLWEKSLPSALINWLNYVDVCVVDNHVIAGYAGYVSSLSFDGTIVWTTPLPGWTSGVTTLMPSNIPSTVIVATAGHIWRLNSATGKIAWSNSLEGHGYSGASVCEVSGETGSYLVCGIAGYLVKIGNSGEKIGQSENLQGTGWYPVSLIHAFGMIYAFSGGVISCHDQNSLKRIWKNNMPNYGITFGGSIATYTTRITQTPLIILGFNSRVFAVNAKTGAIVWNSDFPGLRQFVSLMISTHNGEDVLWCAGCGNLVGLDPTHGTVVAKDNLSGLLYYEASLGTIITQQSQQSSNLLIWAVQRRTNKNSW